MNASGSRPPNSLRKDGVLIGAGAADAVLRILLRAPCEMRKKLECGAHAVAARALMAVGLLCDLFVGASIKAPRHRPLSLSGRRK